ncbi:S24 family peptidase [Sphingomonas sp. RS2018]
MEPDAQRAALSALIDRSGASLATLSRVAGRNAAWMQQYLRRGSPRLLPERERGLLARFLGADEAVLGGVAAGGGDIVRVPQLAVTVSAGPGRFATDEAAVASAGYARADLDRLGIAAGSAAVLTVAGDSMFPTIHDGDRILVDRAQRVAGRNGAIWVIRIDDALHVKRLVDDGDDWRIVSDNADDIVRAKRDVEVLGRVALLSRAM